MIGHFNFEMGKVCFVFVTVILSVVVQADEQELNLSTAGQFDDKLTFERQLKSLIAATNPLMEFLREDQLAVSSAGHGRNCGCGSERGLLVKFLAVVALVLFVVFFVSVLTNTSLVRKKKRSVSDDQVNWLDIDDSTNDGNLSVVFAKGSIGLVGQALFSSGSCLFVFTFGNILMGPEHSGWKTNVRTTRALTGHRPNEISNNFVFLIFSPNQLKCYLFTENSFSHQVICVLTFLVH